MSLDKAVAHGKENRKPYRGPAAFDPACQRHGNMGCPMCRGNRTIIDQRLRSRVKDDEEDADQEFVESLEELRGPRHWKED